jgi:hypothetical protein
MVACFRLISALGRRRFSSLSLSLSSLQTQHRTSRSTQDYSHKLDRRLLSPPIMSAPPPHPSHPPPSSFTINRRRSISRSSRSSLGGKPIPGPHYGSAVRRSDPNDSAISESEIGSGSDGSFARMVGSFSATREELRDGMYLFLSSLLRTTALTFGFFFPFSPFLPPPSSISRIHPPFLPLSLAGSARLAALASSQNGPSPFDDDPSSPSLDTDSPSFDSAAASTSPSNLALGRPSQLSKTLGDRLAASGGRGDSTLPTIESNDASPESLNELTPTQSNIGSLAPISAITPPAADLGVEQTPTTTRLASRERAKREESREREREECKEHQPRVMGDDRGGNSHSDDEDELLNSQMVIPEEDEGGSDDAASLSSSLRRRHQAQQHSQPQSGGNERTPLLAHSHPHGHHHHTPPSSPPSGGFAHAAKKQASVLLGEAKAKVQSLGKEDLVWAGKTTVRSIPAVLLGCVFRFFSNPQVPRLTIPPLQYPHGASSASASSLPLF